MTTRIRLTGLLTFVASVLFATVPVSAASKPRPPAGPVAPITVADVRRVAAREVKFNETSQILRRAADSGNRELIEPLKSVVVAWGNDPDYALAGYYAMHALWELGEPRAYFLGHLDKYRDHPWLAHYSILVLGRDPDDELMERLKRIEADYRQRDWDSRLSNAVSGVQRTRDVVDAYHKLPDVGQRIDELLKNAGSTWLPMTGINSDPIDARWPMPFWARRELRNLSSTHGPLIAQRLAVLDIGGGWGKPEEAHLYMSQARDYVAQFLPEDVRAEYKRLKK